MLVIISISHSESSITFRSYSQIQQPRTFRPDNLQADQFISSIFLYYFLSSRLKLPPVSHFFFHTTTLMNVPKLSGINTCSWRLNVSSVYQLLPQFFLSLLSNEHAAKVNIVTFVFFTFTWFWNVCNSHRSTLPTFMYISFPKFDSMKFLTISSHFQAFRTHSCGL